MNVSPGETGFGTYRMNLLALFDPSGFDAANWSFLYSLPWVRSNNNYEGFVYLGLGLIAVLLISLPISQCTPPIVDRMKEILRSHPGKREVHMQIDDQGVFTTMKIDALVTASPSLSADLKSILGPDCLVRI
jgi:hypothetical protein